MLGIADVTDISAVSYHKHINDISFVRVIDDIIINNC